jgi:Family of unknown function (DUF6518)
MTERHTDAASWVRSRGRSPAIVRGVIWVVATLVGLAFGAGDQYIGSLKPMVALGVWTISLSQMSALWLFLPFAFGWTQDRARRAALVGLVATGAGLVGYLVMMLSPAEGLTAHEIPHAAVAWVATNLLWFVGGAVTGPVFGYLGYRWRSERWWVAAAIVAGAFLLEPVIRMVSDRVVGPSWMGGVEAAVGACLVLGFIAVAGLRHSAVPGSA